MSTTHAETTGGPASRGAGRLTFRGDIDGLRAIAILLVVGYHADVAGFSGGFVGVDVFFVVSGFLITRILLEETRDGRGIGLISFWGKRIRRLVPALGFMVVVTGAISTFVLSPSELRSTARSGAWASVYLSNVLFARAGTDYFAPDLDLDMYLHTWSLGVEEQFYVVWPLLLVAAIALAALSRRSRRGVVIAMFSITVAASLAYSVWLTGRGSPWAFFGLPTRMWEFAAAGLLAALPVGRWLSRSRIGAGAVGVGIVSSGMVVAGLGLIIGASVMLNDTDPYPGSLALLPVVGALLVVAAGSARGSVELNLPSRLLTVEPLQWLGRVSYSWYLWHWPLMLLAVAAVNRDSVRIRVFAAAIALVVAYAAQVLVENPVRFSAPLKRSNRLTYGVGIGATALVLLTMASAFRVGGDRQLESPHRELAAEAAEFESFRFGVCGDEVASDGEAPLCVLGDPEGTRTVLLVGDSHARQWANAFSDAAESRGVRIVLRWGSGCPATDVPVRSPRVRGHRERCERFRAETRRIMTGQDVDAVVIAQANVYPSGKLWQLLDDQGRAVDEGDATALWAEALETGIGSLRASGLPVGVVLDNPFLPSDPALCIDRRGGTDGCTPSRDEALANTREATEAEKAAIGHLGAVPVLSPTDAICDESECHLEYNGDFVFVDPHHLSDSFTHDQIPAVEDFLGRLVAG